MTETIFDHDRMMLTRMAMIFNGVAESQGEYRAIDDSAHEHRFAEHEHKRRSENLTLRPTSATVIENNPEIDKI